MKILVFGATGGTGKLVVQQALENGYNVTAFVRDPLKMQITHPDLDIVQGDVMIPATIDKVMKGHDAVICCLGLPANKPGNLRSKGTQHILDSMQQFGVNRFICQTSLGYADGEKILANTSFVFRKIIVPFLLKKTFMEHERQENIIKQTNLSWTIARPGNMTNGKLTGNYKAGFDSNDRSVKVKISRADTAHFMLQQLHSNDHVRQAVGLSY
jgi:putative NADH-flavin reductase